MKIRLDEQRRVDAWPKLRAVVDSSGIEEVEVFFFSTNRYRPRLSYTYLVDGISHTGTRLRMGLDDRAFLRDAQVDLRPYVQGAVIEVHVDPADPSSSIIESAAILEDLCIWLGAAALVAFAAIIGLIILLT
jgi:hypothetical protein